MKIMIFWKKTSKFRTGQLFLCDNSSEKKVLKKHFVFKDTSSVQTVDITI